MQITIATRHGSLEPAQRSYLEEKATKLDRYFDRLMGIELAVEPIKHEWKVEILISAEHKKDFVATGQAESPEAAMDQALHKMEQQLRRYKDRLVHHHGEMPQGGTSPQHPDLPEAPDHPPSGAN